MIEVAVTLAMTGWCCTGAGDVVFFYWRDYYRQKHQHESFHRYACLPKPNENKITILNAFGVVFIACLNLFRYGQHTCTATEHAIVGFGRGS